MDTAKKGEWVEIENIVLKPGERSPNLPDDTKATPLVMWTKGFLENDNASIGEEVTIKTLTDRITKGKLVSINPRHDHDFGEPVKDLISVGMELKKEMEMIQKERGELM